MKRQKREKTHGVEKERKKNKRLEAAELRRKEIRLID